MTDGLILHLPLTEPLDAGPIDRSPLRHEVHVEGAPLLHGDRQLGAAHRFRLEDSIHVSSIALPDQSDFSIQFWVRLATAMNGTGMVFSLGSPNKNGITLYTYGGPCALEIYENGQTIAEPILEGLIGVETWSQISITNANGTLTVWKNGEQFHQESGFGGLSSGSSLNISELDFIGSMTQIRAYDRVLSANEIEANHEADLTLRAAYVESHPIRLSLLDANDDAVIYMSDHVSGEPLTLEFFNLAGRPLFFDPLPGKPGRDNHHFELRFRPGTLHRSTMTRGKDQLRLLDEADWALSDPVLNTNGAISFFLIRRTPDDIPLMLASERAERIELTNVRADPTAGARTGRVEMLYAHQHLGGTNQRLLHGATVSQFSILSHIGRSHLPIHTCFIGGNTILPGAQVTDNKLTLRLTNLESELPIPWQPGNDPWDDDKRISYFEIGFDYQLSEEDKPWALCRTDEAINVRIDGVTGSGAQAWQTQASPEGEPRAWRIYSDSAPHLERSQHIEITLSGIITTLPSGSASLYIRYANIPGYQAGQIVMTVEKSHLIMREERVGIGTNRPLSPLHIAGSDGLIVGDDELFIKVHQYMIELQSKNSQAFFLPESLTMRDRQDIDRRSDLRPSGLTLYADRERSTLEPASLTVGDREKYVKIGRHIELEDGAGNTILHPQSLTFRDSDNANRNSSFRLSGLTLYNETGTTKLDSDRLTIADQKQQNSIDIDSRMLVLKTKNAEAFFLAEALTIRDSDNINRLSSLTESGVRVNPG